MHCNNKRRYCVFLLTSKTIFLFIELSYLGNSRNSQAGKKTDKANFSTSEGLFLFIDDLRYLALEK